MKGRNKLKKSFALIKSQIKDKIMTKEQRDQVIRVCGPEFGERDIPPMWRNEKIEVSMEYPLGCMIEPYDIEREKELTK